jgi:type II secretory pathway pseudopilin PulG
MRETALQSRFCRAGFSLIELLLTIVLLMMLVGASIYSLSSLRVGSDLNEGVERLETLFRYARAHAANSGRQVRIVFPSSVDGAEAQPAKITVLWEPDPLGKPGEFVELTGQGWTGHQLEEMIAIESLQGLVPGNRHAVVDWMDIQDEFPERTAGMMSQARPVAFFPDGSSDSVEVVLRSLEERDQRRFSVRLVGITGSIFRTELSGDDGEGDFDQHGRAREREGERPGAGRQRVLE